jgi:hypothetical protein
VGETLWVDRVTLEDLQSRNDAKFEILQGYYYDEGRNDRISEVINECFKERLKLKAQGNPLADVYKIILVSSYGKMGQKAVEKQVKYVDEKDHAAFLDRSYHLITQTDDMGNGQHQHRVEYTVELDQSFNQQHVACEVLSMSKQTVNEVSDVLDEMGEPPLYTDTDSLHIYADIIPELEQRFRQRYGRELVGKNLGQFHCDFAGEGHPVAVESIFLAKKVYCDVLVNDQGVEKVHFRMKRVSYSVLERHVNRDFDGDVMGLYRYLYAGNPYTFDLKFGGCVFRTERFHDIVTLDESTLIV